MTRTVTLGDVEVPRIGLGTNRLTHTPEHVAFVRDAVAAGLRVVDTAHTYAGGQSEATIGAALAPIPTDCVVATKVGWNGARAEQLRAEVDESLRRLGTDTLALVYLHRVDADTPLEESLAALAECRDDGTIRHVGLSNVSVEQIERGREIVPVAAVQNHFSLAERRHDDAVDYCEREGIIFVAYFPLRGVGGPPLEHVASRHGATPTQVALAWLLARSEAILPIPGTLSGGHLRENLAALEIDLTEADLAALA